jgi:aminodeoxyfutalosine synthase
MQTPDLLAQGRMANWVRTAAGDQVFFVINRYINPTNVCACTCSSCDFAKHREQPAPMN